MAAARTRRGGVRTGAPGVTYSNRTDLNVNRTLPVAAPTGLGYGERKALVDSQQQEPLRPAPAAAPVSGPAPLAPPAAVAPAPITPLDAASQRPDEPITAGLPHGPGPGLEALGLGAGQPGRLADVIAAAAQASGASDLGFLADQARRLGQ